MHACLPALDAPYLRRRGRWRTARHALGLCISEPHFLCISILFTHGLYNIPGTVHTMLLTACHATTPPIYQGPGHDM